MASLSDIFRALGFGTVSGLGSAEEQRTNAMKQANLDLQRKRYEEEAAWRKQQVAESGKVHELEWGYATPEELAPYLPYLKEAGLPIAEGSRIRRRDIPTLTTLAGQTLTKKGDLVDLNALYEMAGLPAPTRTTIVPGQAPGEFGTYGETPTEMPVAVTRPAPPMKVPGQRLTEYSSLMRTLRESADKTQKSKDTAAARGMLSKGQALETILAEFPSLTAKDVAGYEPAAPERPGQPIETEGGGFQRYNPVTGRMEEIPGGRKSAPAAEREAARKDREARAKLTEESTRLQNEIRQARLDQIAAEKEADQVEELMDAQKPVNEKAKDRAAKNLEASAKDYRSLAETGDPTSQDTYMALAAKLLVRAAKIRAYNPGQPKAPTGKAMTGKDYIKKLEGR